MSPIEDIVLLLFTLVNVGLTAIMAIMLVVVNKNYTEILKAAVIKQIGK